MSDLAVILAAGRSSRFEDPKTKLLKTLGGVAIVNRVVDAVIKANFSPLLILGYQREFVQKAVETKYAGLCQYTIQEQQRGTGHAFYMAKPFIREGFVLVINGDCPLITSDLLLKFYDFFDKNKLDLAIISAQSENPFGYGRIIQTKENGFLIVEEKDLTLDQKQINIINGGIYLFSSAFLKTYFTKFIEEKILTNTEINITDLFNFAAMNNASMSHYLAPFKLVSGVNNLIQYTEAENLLNQDAQ